jgi:hypothetical protein
MVQRFVRIENCPLFIVAICNIDVANCNFTFKLPTKIVNRLSFLMHFATLC